ncbi:hypothetical protein BGZ46_006702 [Entomortierella lignicola]|nr:hypothetical protein BGZ46_006702 [Entomortierella lignicola]
MDSLFPPHDQIQEQRRALAEETVSYAIYLPHNINSGNEPVNVSNANQVQNELSELKTVQLTKTFISSIVTELAQDYIWHKDAFNLRIESNKEQSLYSQPYLRGETRVGDSLDDEWMIVFLLREITKRVPGSVARIQDNDGEFLLIEAADYIPSWLDPDNSENRVFIYDGSLHIIPIAVTAEEKSTFPSTIGTKLKSPKLHDALDIIRSGLRVSAADNEDSRQEIVSTLASLDIQRAAFGPILSDSSEQHFAAKKILDQRHYARCQIPVEVAVILQVRPELITRACEAFYTRDALAMAACSRMEKFLPVPSGSVKGTTLPPEAYRLGKNENPFVSTAVCFTKTCYAQVMGQQFRPPKVWDGIVPTPSGDDNSDLRRVKEAELGMKLTCGFEILCSSEYPGDFGFKSGAEIKVEDFPFATDNGWRAFKNNLTNRKYFGNEHPSSQEYRKLEETAKLHYLEYKTAQLKDDGNPDISSFGSVSFNGHGYHPVEEIERILDTLPENSLLTNLVDNREDDNDSWMDVDLQMLEDMMRVRGFGGASLKEADKTSNGGLDMQEMLTRFGEFIQEGEGGIEGAEFLDEQSSSDESESEEENDSTDEEEGGPSKHSKASEADGQACEALESGNENDEDDDDIFASDYEERQAKKLAAKRGGGFMFENDMMSFDNGVVIGSADSKAKVTQVFGVDREKFKNILTQTFGERPSKTTGLSDYNDNDGDEDESGALDEQDLKEYMAALDAELAGTKIGESFEKMPAASKNPISPSASNIVSTATKMKGKVVDQRPSKSLKPEKNLEELVKEYAERSRRGYNLRGPFSISGNQYGYDPSAVAFADDEDDGDDDDDNDIEVSTVHVTAISPEDEVGEEIGDEEAEEIVDVDLNLAKNLLESFKSQGGLPGPGSNILSRLGIVLPRDEGDEEDE